MALHAANPAQFGNYPKENRPDASWLPESQLSLQEFLESEIPDLEGAEIKVIEWRPSLSLYGESYVQLLSEAAKFIKRIDANARTVKAFGLKWFKNFFRNINIIGQAVFPVTLDFPIVMTGAGPGLEDTIPLIRENRSALFVLAVSSSVASLKAAGIKPDLVLGTDGGNWALLHFHECFRGEASNQAIAASLSAALPSQCGESPVLTISDSSLWQDLVLKGLGIPYISLAQRGTVTATALDLAFYLTRGTVFFTGVDLSNKDIRTHARPYSFDMLWEEKSCRLNPFYSQIFSRSEDIKTGGSHSIYASWFKTQLEAYPKRLYSLGPNNPVFENLAVSSLGKALEAKGNSLSPIKTKTLSFPENPAKTGAKILKSALINPLYTARLIEELCPLLCPEEAPISLDELGESLMAVLKPYWGQGRE
ncbi:6-hydroxymethylpterin diphosphokinase MptE-like protein [Leadbettera azotonutricia]|uniref:6-hydroxymethylpterin diphosphokinase MptE-like protein n=1 Tax=Leadbettera azotonutricia TaxID=150829 RepID=UPI00145F037E|nr:6-hydroxymethylpterin diphosphokinase MptE-like protein [Leadbettera azotonutricia]